MSSDEEVEVTNVESKVDSMPEGLSLRKQKKWNYAVRLNRLCDTYKSILVIGITNVGSKQMQGVRAMLRGEAELLMGKNTLIRSVLRRRNDPKYENLANATVQNVGFVFTNGDLNEIRKKILAATVPAAAKAGTFAPNDVFVPPGSTGMDPGQTAFFQALSIATKIERGSISITDEVHLLKPGDKVTPSHVVLLQKLNIQPFSYGITVEKVWDDGSLFDAAVLDLTEADLLTKFMQGVSAIAALGFETGYPTTASVPFQMRYAFKKIVAVSLESGYEFKEAVDFITGAAAAAASAPTEGAAAASAAAPKKEEESEEESVGGFGGMF